MLFSNPKRLQTYFSHRGVCMSLVKLLYLSVTKPLKIVNFESKLMSIWTLIVTNERTFKQVLDSVPDWGSQLWHLLLKDAGKHAPTYRIAISVLKLLSSRPGGSNLLPEIITAFGSLSSVESCSNAQKRSLLASIISLILYFDPKYVPFMVKKTKLLQFLESFISQVESDYISSELCDRLFSIIRYIGQEHLDLLNEYNIWEPIQNLATSEKTAKQVLAFKLVEQFGISQSNSILALLNTFKITGDTRMKFKVLHMIEALVVGSKPAHSIGGEIAKEMVVLLRDPPPFMVESAITILESLDFTSATLVESGLLDWYTNTFELLLASEEETLNLSLTPEQTSWLKWFLDFFHSSFTLLATPVAYETIFKSEDSYGPRFEKVNIASRKPNWSLSPSISAHLTQIDFYRRISGPFRRGWGQLEIKRHISLWVTLLKTTPDLYTSHLKSVSKFLDDLMFCLTTRPQYAPQSGEQAVMEDILAALLMIRADSLKLMPRISSSPLSTQLGAMLTAIPPQFYESSSRYHNENRKQIMGQEFDMAYPEGTPQIWNSFSIELREFVASSLAKPTDNDGILSRLSDLMMSQLFWCLQSPVEILDIFLHLSAQVFPSYHSSEPKKIFDLLVAFSNRVWNTELLNMASKSELGLLSKWITLAIRSMIGLDPDSQSKIVYLGEESHKSDFVGLTKLLGEIPDYDVFSQESDDSQDHCLVAWYEDVQILKFCFTGNHSMSPAFNAKFYRLVSEVQMMSEDKMSSLHGIKELWKMTKEPAILFLHFDEQIQDLLNEKGVVAASALETTVENLHRNWPFMKTVYATRTHVGIRLGFAMRLSILLQFLLCYTEADFSLSTYDSPKSNFPFWENYDDCTIPTVVSQKCSLRAQPYNRVLASIKFDSISVFALGNPKHVPGKISSEQSTKKVVDPMNWRTRMDLLRCVTEVLTDCIDAIPFYERIPNNIPGETVLVSPREATFDHSKSSKHADAVYVGTIMWCSEVLYRVALYPCPSVNKVAMNWLVDSFFAKLPSLNEISLCENLMETDKESSVDSKSQIMRIWCSQLQDENYPDSEKPQHIPHEIVACFLLHSNDPHLIAKIFQTFTRLVDSGDKTENFKHREIDLVLSYCANVLLARYINQMDILLRDPLAFERKFILSPIGNVEFFPLVEVAGSTQNIPRVPSLVVDDNQTKQSGGNPASSSGVQSGSKGESIQGFYNASIWKDSDEFSWATRPPTSANVRYSDLDSSGLASYHCNFYKYQSGWQDYRPLVVDPKMVSEIPKDETGRKETIVERQKQYLEAHTKAIASLSEFLCTVSFSWPSSWNQPEFVLNPDLHFLPDCEEWERGYEHIFPTDRRIMDLLSASDFPRLTGFDFTIYALATWLCKSKMDRLVQKFEFDHLKKSRFWKKKLVFHEIDPDLIPEIADMAWIVLGRSTLIEDCPLSVRNTGGLILEVLLAHEHNTGENRLKSSHPLWESHVSHAMGTYLPYTHEDFDSAMAKAGPNGTPISFATSTTDESPSLGTVKSRQNDEMKSHPKEKRTKTSPFRAIKDRSLYASVFLDKLSVKIEEALVRCINVYAKFNPDFPTIAEMSKKCRECLNVASADIQNPNSVIGGTLAANDVDGKHVVPQIEPANTSAEKKVDISKSSPNASSSVLANKFKRSKFSDVQKVASEWQNSLTKLRRLLVAFSRLTQLNPDHVVQTYLYRIESCDEWSEIDPSLDEAPKNLFGVFWVPSATSNIELNQKLTKLAFKLKSTELALMEGSLLQKLAAFTSMLDGLTPVWRTAISVPERSLADSFGSILASVISTPQETTKFISSPFWRSYAIRLTIDGRSGVHNAFSCRLATLAARSGILDSANLNFAPYRTEIGRQLTTMFEDVPSKVSVLSTEALVTTILMDASMTAQFLHRFNSESLPVDIIWGVIYDIYRGAMSKMEYHFLKKPQWIFLKTYLVSVAMSNSTRCPETIFCYERKPLSSKGPQMRETDSLTNDGNEGLLNAASSTIQVGESPVLFGRPWKAREAERPNLFGPVLESLVSSNSVRSSANYVYLLRDLMGLLEYFKVHAPDEYFKKCSSDFIGTSLQKLGFTNRSVNEFKRMAEPVRLGTADHLKTNGLVLRLSCQDSTDESILFRAFPINRIVNVWFAHHTASHDVSAFFIYDWTRAAQMRVGMATKEAIQELNKNPFMQVGDVPKSFSFSLYEFGMFSEGRYLPHESFRGVHLSPDTLSIRLSFIPSSSTLQFKADLTQRNSSVSRSSDHASAWSCSLPIPPRNGLNDELYLVLSFASCSNFMVL